MKFLHCLALAGLCSLTVANPTWAAPVAPSAAPAAPAPIELRFTDLYVHPIGPAGLQPTPQLRQAQGQTVRLVGYMVLREKPLPGRFLFTPRPVSMAEHADGEADDLPPATVLAVLPPEQQQRLVAHHAGPLALTGRLEFGPAEDETGRVSWLRLHLSPDALDARATTPELNSPPSTSTPSTR